MTSSSLAGESGATLIELVIVAAILASILAGTIPAASTMLDGFLLAQDTRRIKTILDEFINEAIVGQGATITFSRHACTIVRGGEQRTVALMRSQFVLADGSEQITLSPRGAVTPFTMPMIRNGRSCVLTVSLRGRSFLEC